MSASINLDDLVSAYEWVASDSVGENRAFVCAETGEIHLFGCDGPLDPNSPALDLLAESCLAVPDKFDMDLGSRLVFRFVGEYLPQDEREVHSYFRRRGAYSLFKRLLSERRLLDTWFAYETAAKAEALRSWAAAHGLALRENGGSHAT